MDGRRLLAIPAMACMFVIGACSAPPDTYDYDTSTTPTPVTTVPTSDITVAPTDTPVASVAPTGDQPAPAPAPVPSSTEQAPPPPPPAPQGVTVTQVGIDGVRVLQCDTDGVQLEVKFAVWYTGQGEVRVMFSGNPSHPDDAYGRALYAVDGTSPYRAVLTIAPNVPVSTLVVSAYGANDLLQQAVRENVPCS